MIIYRDDLYVEFRAVPYGLTGKHVLEYRISPDQDLTYEKTISFLGIKVNIKKKFKTNWHKATKFVNWPGLSDKYYDKSEGYLPIFIDTKTYLAWFKNNFHTIGSFFKYIEEEDAKELAKYEKERKEFLENDSIWD